MKKNFLLKCLLASVLPSVGAFAEMSVVKSKSDLTITSTLSGMVIVKIVGPNDEVLVNEKYEGSSFSWTPSGVDGAYRYEVRVISRNDETETSSAQQNITSNNKRKVDVAIGSVEVRNNQIVSREERGLK